MSWHDLPREELEKVELNFVQNTETEGPLILPLVRQGHKESYFADFPFDEDNYNRMLGFIKDKPGFFGGAYVNYEGKPVGFIYYMFRPFLGSRKNWGTVIHSMYIRPDIRGTAIGGYAWDRLFTAARSWGVPRGSKGIYFSAAAGVAVEEFDVLMRANGATYLGGNYFLKS